MRYTRKLWYVNAWCPACRLHLQYGTPQPKAIGAVVCTKCDVPRFACGRGIDQLKGTVLADRDIAVIKPSKRGVPWP